LQWSYWQRVRQREVTLPFRVSFAFSKLLYYKKILRDDHDRVRSRAANVVRTLAWGVKQKSGVRPQRARLIVLSGLDGSGKTAHAGALSQALKTSEVINRVVWSRCGCSPLYRALRSLVSSGAGGGEAAVGRARLRKPVGLLWAWANALDLALLYQWKVRLPLVTGKVIICDRYVADAAVEIAHRLGVDDPMSLAAVRTLALLAPTPDAGYLLDLPAELAARRSLDPEDADEMAAQRDLYHRMASRLRLRALEVAGEFDETNDRLVLEALQEYEDDFATFTNGLLLSNPTQLNPPEGS
jgi:thymidylate kinase